MLRVIVGAVLATMLIGCDSERPQLTGTSKYVISIGVEKAAAAEDKVQSAAVDSE